MRPRITLLAVAAFGIVLVAAGLAAWTDRTDELADTSREVRASMLAGTSGALVTSSIVESRCWLRAASSAA